MIDSFIIWGLWPLGIFAAVEALKKLPAFQEGGRLHAWLPAAPIIIGAVSGPWGAPWLLADTGAMPPAVIGVLIGAGAGLASQGVYDWYARKIKEVVNG